MLHLAPCLGLFLLAAGPADGPRDARLERPTPPEPVHVAPLSTTGPITWYGGTVWDAVDQRWEAIPGGVWTFESGVGSVINTDPAVKEVGLHRTMEGWVGEDRTASGTWPEWPQKGWFRRLTAADFDTDVCVGSATGVLGGNASMWAGAFQSEADSLGWAAGQGYGSAWNTNISQEFPYTGGNVDLSFDFVLEGDYILRAFVLVDTGGVAEAWYTFGGVDGPEVVSGNETLLLTPGVTLPSAPGPVRIEFQVVSYADGAPDWGSDEDGISPTACGAFAVDDIQMTGGIVHSADFETGDDGWELYLYPPDPPAQGTWKDWSTLRAVADLPDSGGAACGLGDSVMVMFDPDGGYWTHPCGQDNYAVSPWIDLTAPGSPPADGVILEQQGFMKPTAAYLGPQYRIQWYPDHRIGIPGPQLSGWVWAEEFLTLPLADGCHTAANPIAVDFSDIVPTDAERVRVAVGLYNYCAFYLCDCFGLSNNSTPWMDNIRVGFFDRSTTGIPDEERPVRPEPQLGFSPNPVLAGAGGTAWFALEERGHARLTVFDVRGRRATLLFAGPAEAGRTEVRWNGHDDRGRPLAAGTYLLRLETPAGARSAKVVLLGN